MTISQQSITQPGKRKAIIRGNPSQFTPLAVKAGSQNIAEAGTKDEITMARICFSQALEERNSATLPKEKLAWDNAAHNWLSTIIDARIRLKESGQNAAEVWDTFIDAIRTANDRQAVKR